MKAIRIAALGAALLSGGALTAGAQQGRRGGPQLDGIQLTDAQKSKLEEIQRKYQPEMMALLEAKRNGGDQGEVMRKGMELREKSGAEIRAILTPAQQAVFDKNVAEFRAQMQRVPQGY
jgi:Spy/CpxP family protein refolding chaperone